MLSLSAHFRALRRGGAARRGAPAMSRSSNTCAAVADWALHTPEALVLEAPPVWVKAQSSELGGNTVSAYDCADRKKIQFF